MNGYTDTGQAERLKEILPQSTADMYYMRNPFTGEWHPYVMEWRMDEETLEGKFSLKDCMPCWSLAALLDVLPYPSVHENADGRWGCDAWVGSLKPYSVSDAESPVDACVKTAEMLSREGYSLKGGKTDNKTTDNG